MKVSTVILVWFLIIMFVLMGVCLKNSYAETTGEGIEIVDIIMIITPTPTPPPAPTPAPTVRPDIAALPFYSYDSADMRCLSRGIWSVTPENPTWETKVAFCELVQNRVDDESGTYADTIRYVLLQGHGTNHAEFADYEPDAHRSEQNDEIADYAMRTWIHAKTTGDRSYRLVPPTGVCCDFYEKNGKNYILVYDRNDNIVYDSGK